VKSAFLNGDLENEIFMRIPQGVESKGGEVWLLHKALYGLKQASREWYLKLKGKLEELGFKRSEADHEVFTKVIEGKIFIITVYVDDQGALDLIKSGQINDRTKHIDTRFRHICDREEAEDIVGEHVATEDQMADIMTKSLGIEKFSGF